MELKVEEIKALEPIKFNYEELKNVFLNKDGHYYRPNRLSRMWSKFSKQNNIKLTFNATVMEYIGEFDLVINPHMYEKFLEKNGKK